MAGSEQAPLQKRPRLEEPVEAQSLFARRREKLTGHKLPPEPAPQPQSEARGAGGESGVARARSTAGVWVNRAPVLVLWVAVVSQRRGYSWTSGLTFGKQVAALCAQAKGQRLGILKAKEKEAGEEEEEEEEGEDEVTVAGVKVKVVEVGGEPRALVNGKAANPKAAQAYLERAFSSRLEDVKATLQELAATYDPDELEEIAFAMYDDFRPAIPDGGQGWGKPGLLDLEALVKRTQERLAATES